MAIWFFLVLSIFSFFLSGSECITITFTNNCPVTVWPGILTGTGTAPLTSGFELGTLTTFSVGIPTPWSGRFWARTLCATDPSGKFVCGTGDCGTGQIPCGGAGGAPPTSLIELTLAGNGGADVYGISLVDGFNVPVSLSPQGGSCAQTSCPANVNAVCPPELAVRQSDGGVIACKSACIAFNQPEYCCTGSFASPDTCHPNKYSLIFKNQCPGASSYAFDNQTSTLTCTGATSYAVTFCP